jgi:hypothetical protein
LIIEKDPKVKKFPLVNCVLHAISYKILLKLRAAMCKRAQITFGIVAESSSVTL